MENKKAISSGSKRTLILSAFGGIVFLFGMAIRLLGGFTFLEYKVYDFFMNATASMAPRSDDICIVGVNQSSINMATEERGWSWPWPREANAEIVEYMKICQAKCIAFDVFYTEPSVYGEGDDIAFADASADYGKVVQTIHLTEKATNNKPLVPIDSIKNSAAMLGYISSASDSDNIIRRANVSLTYDGKTYAALGLAPLLLESENIEESLEEIKSSMPLNKDGTVNLRFKGSIDRYVRYDAYDIIKSYEAYKNGEEPFISPQDLQDSVVFFILYAPGLYDICPTPISQTYPGAGVHITMLDNYLLNGYVKVVPEWLSLVLMALYTALAVFFAMLTQKMKTRSEIIFLAAVFILGPIFIFIESLVAFIFSISVPVISIVFCYFAAMLGGIIFNYSWEGKQKRFIKSAFSQYLSPAIIDRMIAEPDKLKLGGERRHISIFFSDIESFTSLSETMADDPARLTDLLNTYLTEMTNIILRSGGTIDKYEGDAIIAFWNAPTDQAEHAKSAVMAAVECQKRLGELEEDFKRMAGRPLKTRIGLNTGDAIVGNMGSSLRFDYTMLGDSVNLASRLEGLNKQFGTYVMCTKATKDEAVQFDADVRWRELGRVAVVGKTEIVTVYEPMSGREYELRKGAILRFEKALAMFYAGDLENARIAFEQNAEYDPPSAMYAKKCEQLAGKDFMNWNGVWIASSK